MPYTYDYPRPAVSVDVVLLAPAGQTLQVLLIQRQNEPFKGHWALPGGFLDIDEELPDAARRELQEETGLQIDKLLELGVFGAIGRDPRGRMISVAYLALLPTAPVAQAGDDAAAAAWFACDKLPELAFDHAQMLERALQRLQELAARPVQLSELLLAPKSDIDTLHTVLQAITGQVLNRTNLRRRLRRVGFK